MITAIGSLIIVLSLIAGFLLVRKWWKEDREEQKFLNQLSVYRDMLKISTRKIDLLSLKQSVLIWSKKSDCVTPSRYWEVKEIISQINDKVRSIEEETL